MRRVFLDTNILVYLVDSSEPSKQMVARQTLRDLGRQGAVVLSTQVLQEFYVTVTRKLRPKHTPDQALDLIQDFRRFPIVKVSASLIQRSIELSRDHQISFWDALILCAAVEGGCEQVLTEDLQHGFRWQGLEIVNPFLTN